MKSTLLHDLTETRGERRPITRHIPWFPQEISAAITLPMEPQIVIVWTCKLCILACSSSSGL